MRISSWLVLVWIIGGKKYAAGCRFLVIFLLPQVFRCTRSAFASTGSAAGLSGTAVLETLHGRSELLSKRPQMVSSASK